ncbi:MAG: ADP-ribosylglycohydrolase family protein [bacterium]|nr:ADP-ribosylglycohydrolase family protein [bacterium]
MKKLNSIKGCLLGTAVGDALGLVYENLSKKRQEKLYPGIDKYHFLFGKGMCSDDTEHTVMAAQSIISCGDDAVKFGKTFAWKLRAWVWGLPAGVGFGTLRAIIKLWLGFPPGRSGVFSAGNGPAMRAPVLGVCFGENFAKLKEFVKINTSITHSDPKAEYGAFAVALAAHMAHGSSITNVAIRPVEFYERLEEALKEDDAGEFLALIKKAVVSVDRNETTASFAAEIGQGRGVSGYIYHTVPVAIQCWLRNRDNFKNGIIEIIRCGGDTDTTAAILGGILGAGVGKEGIPKEWIESLFEFPRSAGWIEKLAEKLYRVVEEKKAEKPLKANILLILIRNFIFMLVVLFHGFRRLFPPY